MEAPLSPMSPKSSREEDLSDEATGLQVQQFLDDWHFRVIHSSLGITWHRSRVVDTCLSILEINGVSIDPEDREEMLDMDEEDFIAALVPHMPQPLRRNLQHMTMQLQVVVSMSTRLRKGLEENRDQDIQEVLEEADGAGIAQQIMKEVIVHAAREVVDVRKQQKTWYNNMSKRMARLTSCAAVAEKAQQQLLAVEAQLSQFGENQNAKNKKVLMGMSDGKSSQLVHTCFSGWVGHYLKYKAQIVMRSKYEKMAVDAEDRLIQYREKKIVNIRNVLMRKAGESDNLLAALCVETWQEYLDDAKKQGGTKEEMERMQRMLVDQRENAKSNTTAVMTRMAADSDDALVSGCFAGWVKFSEEYKKDKEVEDQVKATEKALAAHMAAKKEDAKGVLDRMAGASGSGLVMQCLKGWKEHIEEDKKDRELANVLNGNADRFKSLQDRQAGNARGVQTRVNDQMKTNLMLRCIGVWQIDAKVARIEKYYLSKLEGKRKQLQSCQTLFKSFAAQLEQGLNAAAEDPVSSGRHEKKHRSQKAPSSKGLSKAEGSVSLPDIHSRPVVG